MVMKKKLLFCMTLLMVLCLGLWAAATAEGETSDFLEGWNWEQADNVLTLAGGYQGSRTDLHLYGSGKLGGEDVTVQIKIGPGVFPENTTSIVLENMHIIFDGGEDPSSAGSESFCGLSSLTKLNLINCTCENLVNMDRFLDGDAKLTNLDIRCLDTGRVTSMWNMFQSCESLTSLDVSWMNTDSVTNMSNMFGWCKSLTSLTLGKNFNTANVRHFDWMFAGVPVTTLDVSGFDTSSATNMASMFQLCEKLRSIDVSGFDTAKVTDLNSMFNSCASLTELDVSSFSLAAAQRADNMFTGCTSLNKITLGSGYRFIEYDGDYSRFPDVYGGPEWVSAKENKAYDPGEIIDQRGGIADTYTRMNPYTLSSMASKLKGKKTAGGVTISWGGGSGADYFHIYRADNVKKQNYTFLGEVDGKTKKFTDSSLKAGREYSYKVMAVRDFYGSLIDSTAGLSTESVRWMKLSAVKSFKAKNSASGKAALTWKKTVGATGYEIYYSTKTKAPKDSTKALHTVKKLKLDVKKLTKGKTYLFYIRPYVQLSNKTVVYGDWSNAVKLKIGK